MDITLIFLWYLFVGVLIVAFKLFYNLINKKRFRGGQNDPTSEIGFECESSGSTRDNSPKGRRRPTKKAVGMGIKLK